MRTEPPSPLALLPVWLRAYAGRGRRWLAARGAATRVGLLLVVLGGLVSVGYFATLDDSGDLSPAWIFEGHKLSSDEILAISDALEAEGIAHVADQSTGKVGVKPARKAEALAALTKHKVFPRTLEDLSREEPASPWELPEDRQRRELAACEKVLKYQIQDLNEAILSANVKILRTRSRSGLNAPWNVSVSVYLKIKGRRRLDDHRVIEGIEAFLKGSIPDLNPKAITVVDQSGNKYLSDDNPSLKEQLKTHAQEETWREQITEALRHIPGVGVDVLLEVAPELPPLPVVAPVVARELVVPNGSVAIDPDPPAEVPAPPVQPPRNKANVWVRVPRSFYFLDFAAKFPNRLPTQEDLDQMKETTEKLIHDAVGIHIPKDDLGEVRIAVIQDDLTSPRPMTIASAEPHRPWIWAALSGVVVLSGVAAVGAMVRLATRRQPTRPSRTSWKAGYVDDGPTGPLPGPSERVRELIRLNPEAAAGVLQRWIGQGGALP